MGLGGGATGGTKSAKLVAGIRDEFAKLQPLLDRVVQATNKIAENLTKAKSASSLGFAGGGTGGTTTSLGYIDQGPASGMSFSAFSRGLKTAAAVGITAGAQALDLTEFAESSISRARVGFFSGQGAIGAGMSFQSMMNRGTAINALDAARAQMVGASAGLMPGLPGYGNVAAGAEMFSNLVPGAGLAGGMQAMAALNQAPNVNRLRMIGIQVRDPSTGTMRSPEAIAGDLWNKLNSQKTGSNPISKRDIAISLQSGNSLDMLLNQYFGNDPVLRQGIVTALMQKAGGGGLSREELIASGALPELAASTGERNAAAFGAINALTGDVEQGMMGANRIIADAANTIRDAADVFGGAVGLFAGTMQLAGGGNGAFGTIGGGILGGLSTFGGALLGGRLGGRLGTRGGGAGGRTGGRLAGSMAFKGASKLIPGVGAAVQGYSSFQQGSAGEEFDLGGTLLSSLVAAGLGFLAGGPAGAAIAGLGTFGASAVGYGLGSVFGEGDGEDASAGEATPSSFNPLDRLDINAPYLKKRDYLIDGKPPANPFHTGVDFDAKVGDPVYAVKDGTVLATKYNANGFGHSVKLRHNDGHSTVYAHLSQKVVESGSVRAGQLIGYAGNSGLSSGPHLHFEVRKNADDQSTHVDPLAYLAGSSTPSGAAPMSANEASREATSGLLGDLSSGVALLPGLSGAPNPKGEGGEAGYASTTNYGGVTVNINVPKGSNLNEQNLANEIKRVLNDQEMLKKAVSR